MVFEIRDRSTREKNLRVDRRTRNIEFWTIREATNYKRVQLSVGVIHCSKGGGEKEGGSMVGSIDPRRGAVVRSRRRLIAPKGIGSSPQNASRPRST